MKPFELRLAEQHARNAMHVRNLVNFCNNPARLERLDPIDQDLILRQLQLQQELNEILEIRMRRLNIPV